MSCTFVPPYLLQRIALRAGTRHASASGRETLQVDDRPAGPTGVGTGSHGRSTSAWRQNPGGAHCQLHGVAARGGCPERWRSPGR